MQILAWFFGVQIILLAIIVGYRLKKLIKGDIQKQEQQQNNKTHPNQYFQQQNITIDECNLKPQSYNQQLVEQQNSQSPSNNFRQNNSASSDFQTIADEDPPIEIINFSQQKSDFKTKKNPLSNREFERNKKDIEYLSFRQKMRTQSKKSMNFTNQDEVKINLNKKEMEPLISNRSQNQKLIGNNSSNNSNENQNDHTIINIFQDNNQDNYTKQCKNQQDKDENQNDHTIINIQQDNNQDNDKQQYKGQQNKDDKIRKEDQQESYKSKIENKTDVEQKFDKNNQDLLNEKLSNDQNHELAISSFYQNQNNPSQNEIEIIEKNNVEIDNQSQKQSLLFDLTSPDNINQQNYKYMRVNNNKLMYVNDKDKNYTGVAFSYKVQYDMDNNPKYEIYEGSFDKGKKSGKGILYGGKSKFINYEGEWKEDKQYNDTKEQQDEVKINIQQTGVPKKKILIYEEGELIQIDKKNQNLKTFSSQPQWVKYNQQYSIKDMDILKSETIWFTSSIIDGFVQYLNIQLEKYLQFFYKKDVKRYLFCPSYLYTNMSKDRIEDNLITYQNHILEYKPINYNLKTLFSRIYFAINKNNSHFFLIYVDLPSKSLNIVDSIKKRESFYQTEIEIFKNIFQQQITSNKLISCIQQRNGYDCGPHTCLNMYQDFYDLVQNVCPQKEKIQINNPQQMRKFLFDILQNQDNKL